MPEKTPTMDVLFAIRDLGVAEPLPDVIDIRAGAALQREIDQASRPGRNRGRRISRRVRRTVLILAALLLTAAAAGAATGVLNPFQVAHDNATDTPTHLFETNLDPEGVAKRAALWHQTLFAATVRNVETFTVPGVGPI